MSDIAVGDVVQIDPAHDDIFGGQFLTVTELKTWGVMGYCKPLERGTGLAYYRVPFEKITRIGKAEWRTPLESDGDPGDETGYCRQCKYQHGLNADRLCAKCVAHGPFASDRHCVSDGASER